MINIIVLNELGLINVNLKMCKDYIFNYNILPKFNINTLPLLLLKLKLYL